MRTTTFVVFTLLLGGCVCSQPEKDKTAFSKITGVWVEIGNTKPFIEIWHVLADETLHGRGGQINEKDTLFFEELIISTNDKNSYYRAILPNRDPVDFTLNKSSPDYLEWSNPENDFPADIIYYFIGNDTLRIILRGVNANDTIIMERKTGN